jgi:GNAT superfamily N-acetyltransferase
MFKVCEEWLIMGRRLPVEPDEDETPPGELEDGSRFRVGGLTDVPVVAALEAESYGELALRAAVIQSWLERGDGLGVLEREGRAIGFVTWARQGTRGLIRRLGVHPGERRKGYGSALLEQAADRVNRLGARRLELTIVPNPTTIGFAKANRLSQQGAGLAYRKRIGDKPEPTGMIIRGFGWSDMRRRR